MTRTWTQVEVELIVEDYFSMLVKELSGIPYRKSDHRKRLKPLLNGRSEGSIEYKHQNISAVLVQYGQLYLKGYLPRFNYQRLLEQAVLDHLSSQSSIKGVFSNFVEGEIDSIPNVDFDQILVDPPSKRVIAEPEGSYSQRRLSINYLEREQRNQRLGKLGEELVVKYEQWQLSISGHDKLATQVEWVSQSEGDGAGFDILSKNFNGSDKYIEVKTTRLGKETPFFFSRNELRFSQRNRDSYHLYRLFNFGQKARMFKKLGDFDSTCTFYPFMYKGFP